MTGTYVGALLLVTGIITLVPIVLTLAPQPALRILFGDPSPNVLTQALARHWGLLVALVGALLVYAASHADARAPVMVVAAVEKFGVGIIFGFALPRRPVLVAVIVADAVMALLYVTFLAGGCCSL
ncbi:MAG TPA: hypothetical protein VFE16_01080 [Candidatus Cybelea sp.]|nr:hypothetical protein [Candidatus Cybelea sp.]